MRYIDNKKTIIEKYYGEMNSNAVFIDTIFDSWKICKGYNQKRVIVSNSRFIRKIAALLKMRRASFDKVQLSSEQYFAMKDAFLLLSKKNVPVYYINRVGKEKTGFVYSDTALNRMRKHLNFPIMYENASSYVKDLRELFGDLYSEEYIREIGRIPQVIKKGDSFCHEDYASRYVNVIEGQRVVCYQPKNFIRT